MKSQKYYSTQQLLRYLQDAGVEIYIGQLRQFIWKSDLKKRIVYKYSNIALFTDTFVKSFTEKLLEDRSYLTSQEIMMYLRENDIRVSRATIIKYAKEGVIPVRQKKLYHFRKFLIWACKKDDLPRILDFFQWLKENK